MNGPQHYREAERLADQANHYTYGDGADSVTGQALATEALVHATLTLVALGVETSVMHPSDTARPDVAEWRTVLDPPPPAPEEEFEEEFDDGCTCPDPKPSPYAAPELHAQACPVFALSGLPVGSGD